MRVKAEGAEEGESSAHSRRGYKMRVQMRVHAGCMQMRVQEEGEEECGSSAHSRGGCR